MGERYNNHYSGEAETESLKISTTEEEEGGLPSPLDEGAFFTSTASMERSKLFDGMDDDGRIQIYALGYGFRPWKRWDLTCCYVGRVGNVFSLKDVKEEELLVNNAP